MNDTHIIADKIEKHVNAEKKVNAANRAIGAGKIILQNNEPDIWILNREIRSVATVQRDITGEIRGTHSNGIVEVLPNEGIPTSKNSYWGRTLLENYGGKIGRASGRERVYGLV